MGEFSPLYGKSTSLLAADLFLTTPFPNTNNVCARLKKVLYRWITRIKERKGVYIHTVKKRAFTESIFKSFIWLNPTVWRRMAQSTSLTDRPLLNVLLIVYSFLEYIIAFLKTAIFCSAVRPAVLPLNPVTGSVSYWPGRQTREGSRAFPSAHQQLRSLLRPRDTHTHTFTHTHPRTHAHIHSHTDTHVNRVPVRRWWMSSQRSSGYGSVRAAGKCALGRTGIPPGIWGRFGEIQR